MITLHNATDTTFTTNGLGVLEPLSCILNLEINGGWSLEMEYPLDPDGKYLKIEEGKIIKVTGIGVVREQTDTYQLFRIYDVNKGLSILKVTAFPVAFEATYDAVVDEYTTGNSAKTINSILNDSSTGLMKKLSDEGITKYTCTVDYTNCPSHKMSWKNTNLIAVISGSDDDSILNKYDAEVAYDNYAIRINHKLGEETGLEIRYGKNLTGLDVDTDTSGVVTRFYPISKEGIRYKGANNEAYVESDEFPQYPFARSAFIQTDYPLVDTNEKSYSNAAILTREAKATIIEDITTVMENIWDDIKSGIKVNNQLYEPEWMQKSLNDIIAEVQASTTLIPADSDAGLANLFRTCIKSGINWIKDEDIADYEWKTVSGDKYYGNSDRDLKNQYYYIDKMYRWFDENGIYHPEKDLNTMDWLNHIGQQQIGTPTKGFGNDTSTIARDAWVFTMDGDNQTGSNFNQYYFDADGCWDGVSEASEWDWQQTDNKWWFGKTGATDPKDYAHDEWVYIYKSSGSAPSNTPKLYYFGSDGYVLYDKSCSWNWYESKQKWYFGVAVTESNRIYLKNQWMKIDGDWYYFNNQELVAKDKTIRLGLVNYIVSQINNLGDFSEYTTRLYNRLYQSMYEHCERLYDEEGYDKPSITVTANVVDLSKTTEYKDFPDLMTIHLGDKVKVIDYVHYPDFQYNMRVVGLQYDCIRGYNTQVTIGDLSKKVSQMISSNLGGKGEQKLVAGENVTIDGNTINAMTNVGDIYAGSQVDVQQVVTSGTEIAKIYVDGYPTSIYASGADVQITRYQTEGTPVADIVVNGQHYILYSDGLQYWHETSEQIWREGVTDGMVADAAYLTDEFEYEHSSSYWATYKFKKVTDDEAICAKGSDGTYFILVSCVNSEAVDFVWCGRTSEGWSEWSYPIVDTHYGLYTPCHIKQSFSYMGKTWYVNWGINDTSSYCYCPFPDIGNEIIPSGSDISSLTDAAKQLIDLAHGAPNRPDKEGISNQDHILFYNSYPNDPNHEDDVFVSKSGVFHGTRYEDADGNPISGGGLSKTELYTASSYSATVNLSSAYTGYQFLLIQTYNADDKEALSTMLNVADLSTGQRIGINDYLLYTITNSTTLSFYSSFDDTNHTRHIKGIYGLKTFNGSDVPNVITDVTVNGSTVVSGGVAQIDLTGYAELTDLASKQDTLIAGQNITIAPDGKTISATGGASSIDTLTDVDLTNLVNGQILKYNSTSQKWENANESGGVSTLDGLTDVDLTSPTDGQILKYDATNQEWINANESGGTTVVANPSGQATADLEKLQVGNDIYSIPSGGGTEVVTDILSLDYQKTTISNSEQSFSWSVIQFEGYEITCNNNPTAPLAEMIWNAPISADVKKIRFKFEPTAKKMSGSDDYNLFIGVKSSFNTSSEPTDQDWLVSKSYNTVVNPIEDELSITTSADYYLYIIANGWDVDITKVESVEYASGGASDLVDLGDVDITTPTDGQVLTYNATSQKWENETPSGGGGVQTFVSTSDPSSSIGSNGDLYFKVSSSDKVQFAYVKVNGTWQVYSDNRVFMTWETLSNIRATSTSGRYNGQTATFKLTNFTDYNKLTADDIFLKWTKYYHSNVFDLGSCTITKTYDAPTGVLTVTSDACLFYNGNYTIEAVSARGCVVKRNVSPASSSGTTATFDISDVDGYASLTLSDIALNLDSIYHTSQYNGTYTITYSYSSSGIITVQTSGSNILDSCTATIAIKKAVD